MDPYKLNAIVNAYAIVTRGGSVATAYSILESASVTLYDLGVWFGQRIERLEDSRDYAAAAAARVAFRALATYMDTVGGIASNVSEGAQALLEGAGDAARDVGAAARDVGAGAGKAAAGIGAAALGGTATQLALIGVGVWFLFFTDSGRRLLGKVTG